jgi:glycosyltransferase involved in cell wall biosynthesis
MKIFSYLDSGKPVLATRLFTHTQVLDDRTAYLVDPNPLAMAGGMEELICDHALGQKLAAHARRRVELEYTPEVLRGKLQEFYDELAASLSHGTTVEEQRR